MSNPLYWLIVRDGPRQADVFTTHHRGGEALLPVFSSREEAQIFVGKELVRYGWIARATGMGELVSVLYGPCKGVRRVALDPPREMLSGRILDLVSLSREAFVDSLLGKGRSWFEEEPPSRVSQGIKRGKE